MYNCFYRNVERVLFNKYWPYAFTILMYSAYASVWSLATIFDDGRFLADYMSRWNLSIVSINYYPFDRIRWTLGWSLGWLLGYATIMIVFTFTEENLVPTIRGTHDLLGLLLLREFDPELRLSENFYLVRAFGLFFHLYAVYCARMLTLWILLYCKFLENLARRWNLRFCYRFGMRKGNIPE
jgi:hypothetical protein